MNPVTENLLRQMTDAIVQTADPTSVYLFGSYAQGRARDDSDLDLLIVVDGSFGPQRSRLAEINRIRRQLRKFRVPKDVLLYSIEEMEKWRHSSGHVIGRCVREGKLLYARP